MCPQPICAEERIGKDDELSHDGDDGDLGRFSGGDEGLIFGFHVGVEAGCDEGWHVECLAQDGTTASDMATPAMLAAVSGNGRKPSEAGDLLVLQLAELGHFDEHGNGCQRADAGDRDQDLEAGKQIGFAVQQGAQGCVDGGDLPVDLCQPLGGVTFQEG